MDKMRFASVLVTDGKAVPLFVSLDPEQLERGRRFIFACDGQEVTVTGHFEAADSSRLIAPYKLADASFAGPCAHPAVDRGRALPLKPMPPEWLSPSAADTKP